MYKKFYCPFLKRIEGRYNRVSADNSARALKEKLKMHGLDNMQQESRKGPLHAFESCKLSTFGICHLDINLIVAM